MADPLHEDNADFDTTEAGVKPTTTTLAFSLEKNGFVMLKDRPCKITEISKAREGKHGAGKVTIVGVDLLTDDEYKDVVHGNAIIDVPHVFKSEYEVADISDGFISIIIEDGSLREVKLPQGDLGNEIQTRFKDTPEEGTSLYVTVLSACGEERVVAFRKKRVDL